MFFDYNNNSPYFEWNVHLPPQGKYTFDDISDLYNLSIGRQFTGKARRIIILDWMNSVVNWVEIKFEIRIEK